MTLDRHITLAHGNGGRYMRELIEEIFARHLANPALDVRLDAAPLELEPGSVPYITTDSFTVQPLEFPGGDIGSLAVNGTVNDLAVSGAEPRFLTLNAIIEEGLEVETLDRIVASLAAAARIADVRIVAGDTKVVPRGQGGGLYFATTGVGLRAPGPSLGMENIRSGDVLLVSGPVGDHGIAVMLAREEFELRGDVRSDCAGCNAADASACARWTVCASCAIPRAAGLPPWPTRSRRHCGMTMRLAGRWHSGARCRALASARCWATIPITWPARAGSWPSWRRRLPIGFWRFGEPAGGHEAARIGTVCEGRGHVILETEIGGERVLEELEDDPLPRIC